MHVNKRINCEDSMLKKYTWIFQNYSVFSFIILKNNNFNISTFLWRKIMKEQCWWSMLISTTVVVWAASTLIGFLWWCRTNLHNFPWIVEMMMMTTTYINTHRIHVLWWCPTILHKKFDAFCETWCGSWGEFQQCS